MEPLFRTNPFFLPEEISNPVALATAKADKHFIGLLVNSKTLQEY